MVAIVSDSRAVRPASVGELAGATLGPYRLEALLGHGNRAAVYRAVDAQGGRAVALRVFDRDLSADLAFVARLRDVVAAVAALGHPHLLPVAAHGHHAGHAYLARPYVPGGSLRARLGAPLPPADALGLLGPVADALDHAHRRAVVHGDLKPGAILLRGPGDPALADLGLAPLLPRENRLLLAAQGRHYGAAEYLAPEQAEGVPAEARTDVYALGVVAYELLTGRPPFRAEGPADTPRAVAARQLKAPPPAPRALNPALGEGVERALLRALAKAPDGRFPSAGALVAALAEAWQAEGPRAAATVPPPARGVALAAARPARREAAPRAVPAPPLPGAAPGPRPAESDRRTHAETPPTAVLPPPTMALAAAAPAPGPGGAGPTADLPQPGEVERLRERLRSREAELAALRLRTAALDHEQEELAARARALEAARRAREVEVGEQAALLRERAAELAALRQRATQAEGERDALTAHVHAQAERLRHREAELVALRRQLAMPSACEECRALRGERDGLRARVRELEQAWDAVMRAFGGRPAAAPAAPPVAQTAGAPPSRLVIVDHRRAGLAEGAAFALRPGMVVGRRAGADIELGDTCVSAEHARLTQEGGSWWATDLGTTNGTFVNGARIVRPTALSAGDEVRFGRVRARLAREPAPGTAGAAASGR